MQHYGADGILEGEEEPPLDQKAVDQWRKENLEPSQPPLLAVILQQLAMYPRLSFRDLVFLVSKIRPGELISKEIDRLIEEKEVTLYASNWSLAKVRPTFSQLEENA